MQNAPNHKFVQGPKMSEFYQIPLDIGANDSVSPTVSAADGSLDVFGVGNDFPSFTIAYFGYRPVGVGGYAGVVWATLNLTAGASDTASKTKCTLSASANVNPYFDYNDPALASQTLILSNIAAADLLGKWIHFAVSSDGTKLRGYFNGVLHDEANWATPIYSALPVYEKFQFFL